MCLWGRWLKNERLKDAEMKRFREKETNSICTAVSACSNYSSFEAESSKTVLWPILRAGREEREGRFESGKMGGDMLREEHGRGEDESWAEGEGERVTGSFEREGKSDKAMNEREERANEGINH